MTVSRIRPELNLLTITPKRPLIVALDVQRRRLERPQRIQNLNKTQSMRRPRVIQWHDFSVNGRLTGEL
jgi:hypothetical protein